MKKKKEIIIFSGYFLPFLGGIERYTDMLSKNLIDQNCNVTIVSSNYNNLPEKELIDGINIIRIPIFNIFKNRYPIPKNSKIVKELQNNKYDIIICNTRFQLTTLLGIKLSKKTKTPLLVIDHSSSHFSVDNKLLDFFGAIYEHILTYYFKCNVKYFYGVSKRCNEWLKHYKILATGVIYNSIDKSLYKKNKDRHFIEERKNKIILTYSGRLIKEKGLYLLCDAYKNLVKKYPNLELYIAGDGPILDDLKKKYTNVHILGKLKFDELLPLYNDTDIFVYPSMYPEGLPTSILEAGIMKCAVIATDRGGTTEVITSEEYGLIMEENQESLEENIIKYITNKELLNNNKENLHTRIIKNFTCDETAKKLLKEMNKLKKQS